MRVNLTGWIAVGIVGGVAAYAIAEEVTLTTYYPSPRGVYEELRTTQNTWLATEGGRVGIGTASPNEKLEVNGGVRLNPVSSARPSCTAQTRGTLWFERDVPAQGRLVDRLEFCARVGENDYEWILVTGSLADLVDKKHR